MLGTSGGDTLVFGQNARVEANSTIKLLLKSQSMSHPPHLPDVTMSLMACHVNFQSYSLLLVSASLSSTGSSDGPVNPKWDEGKLFKMATQCQFVFDPGFCYFRFLSDHKSLHFSLPFCHCFGYDFLSQSKGPLSHVVSYKYNT